MGNIILLATISIIIVSALVRRVPLFETFLEGAREGLGTSISILPALIGLLLGVSMLRASGALELFSQLISPVCSALNIPAEIVPLALMRPVSGSGAMAIVQDVMRQSGVDSFAGRVAAVMMGSSETTFYTIAVYYGSVGIKRTGITLPAALSADFAAFIASSLTVTFLMQ